MTARLVRMLLVALCLNTRRYTEKCFQPQSCPSNVSRQPSDVFVSDPYGHWLPCCPFFFFPNDTSLPQYIHPSQSHRLLHSLLSFPLSLFSFLNPAKSQSLSLCGYPHFPPQREQRLGCNFSTTALCEMNSPWPTPHHRQREEADAVA